MYILDIETMDVESTAVILSLAITHLGKDNMSYADMLNSSIFVKFDAAEQVALGRSVDSGTCKWWDRQAEVVKEASLYPNPAVDMKFADAAIVLRQWLVSTGYKNDPIFTRGALDPVGFDSLYRTFDTSSPIRYNRFLDVRTAIEFLYPNSNEGYVDVDTNRTEFDTSMVIKHHPVHDCAYDGMMMIYGKTE